MCDLHSWYQIVTGSFLSCSFFVAAGCHELVSEQLKKPQHVEATVDFSFFLSQSSPPIRLNVCAINKQENKEEDKNGPKSVDIPTFFSHQPDHV